MFFYEKKRTKRKSYFLEPALLPFETEWAEYKIKLS